MELKTDYYYRSKEGVLKWGGKIVINRYRILNVDGRELPEKGISYYSSPVDYFLKLENADLTVKSIQINRIVIEKDYSANQMEYYISLGWLNQQKLKWINKRHPLQQKKNYLHLGLIILLFYFVYQLIQLMKD
jgi:hypothetical protein